MSDHFEMLVDEDVTADKAPQLSRKLVKRFRELGLITGRLSAACVLGGRGYRPGPGVAGVYKLRKREFPFWELRTCGLEPTVGRTFNLWALGEACQGFTCSSCGAKMLSSNDKFSDRLAAAIAKWDKGSDNVLLGCTSCRKRLRLTAWECKPPLGFGNLSLCFWNWPPFSGPPSWKLDIPAFMREITGHSIVHTYGSI
jgi:hypothetical protein